MTSNHKATKHPGVFKMADGRFHIKIKVRVDGREVFRERTLPAGTPDLELQRVAIELRQEAKTAPVLTPQLPTAPKRQTTTVASYAIGWLELRSRRLKPSALGSHENALINFILPPLGHMPVRDVTRRTVESWVVWAQEQRKPSGKPPGRAGGRKQDAPGVLGDLYQEATMGTWWRTLVTMFKDAAAEFGIPDPTLRVRGPERPEVEPSREQRTLTVAEVWRLVELAEERHPDRYAEILMFATTGMRAGEVYALGWDAVDFDAGEIVVRRSLSAGEITETTKTKLHRRVPMHPRLVTALQGHRRRMVSHQNHRALASGLVFPSTAGTPRDPHALDKPFADLRAAMGTDIRIGAQVLRRSLNTAGVNGGTDRLVLQAIMGHSSDQMTSHYFKASAADKRAALLRLFPAA